MRHAKTQQVIDQAHSILAAFHLMTLRQLFYQLVSRHDVDNSRGAYQALGRALVDARREGLVPWEWIEDRTRAPHGLHLGWRSVERYLGVQVETLGRR